MIKVQNPKSMGNYSGYGKGGPATKKTMPSMKGGNKKMGAYKGANVQTSKYCD
jgi:hypothetical protein